MALLGITKLAKAMINAYHDKVLRSSYYFVTPVYTDCKIFAEKCYFAQIWGIMFRCSCSWAASPIRNENFEQKGAAYTLVFMVDSCSPRNKLRVIKHVDLKCIASQ